jgi:hypothetical protein
MLGPIDYVAIGFVGNNFDGSILEELSKAVDSGAIRVVDLLFVLKDADGEVMAAEVEDQHEELKEVVKIFDLEQGEPLLTEEDVKKLGSSMDNDTAVAVLVIEHLWAKGIKQAIIDKGGFVLDEGRIRPEAVEEAIEELEGLEK